MIDAVNIGVYVKPGDGGEAEGEKRGQGERKILSSLPISTVFPEKPAIFVCVRGA